METKRAIAVVVTAMTVVLCGTVGPVANAGTISYMGFVFDDRAFADDATLLEGGPLEFGDSANNIDEALTGFSPESGIYNIDGSVLIQLDFTDLLASNGTGTDIILFDSHSNDPYTISVHAVGEAEFSPFVDFDISYKTERTYAADEVLPLFYGEEAPYARALLIDLDRFGLAAGVPIDSFRFRALPNAKPMIEGDPFMAAVYSSSTAVPIPPAVWLFGSAIGLMGWMRRQSAANG